MSNINHDDDDDKETYEEDWSSLLCDTANTSYKNHDCITIDISPCRSMNINCITSLTPLDMIALSYGSGDATGNKVWNGALFFIFTFIYPSCIYAKKSVGHINQTITSSCMDLSQLRKLLFHNKIILELGCGTGVSGLSLLASNLDHESTIQESFKPAWVVFTDGDENTLALCRKNVLINLSECIDKNYSFTALKWGDETSMDCLRIHMHDIGEKGIQGFDTLIATDALYDIDSLRPIFQTVNALLAVKGYFILALVPRLSIDHLHAISPILDIEKRIESEAHLYNMKIVCVIRPQDVETCTPNGIYKTHLESMEASILIFQLHEENNNLIKVG